MKKIPLSIYKKNPKHKGLVALVSDEDFEILNQYYWTATEARPGLFYATRSTPRDANGKQKLIYMHHEIMGKKWIDHADRNGLNNTRTNLRFSCPKTNSQNRAHKKNKESKYSGVYKSGKNSFRARIKLDGKFIHLGTRKTAIECAILYNNAALKHRGEFAVLNKI